MGDKHIMAAEISELRPHPLKERGVRNVRFRKFVLLACTRANRDARLYQSMEFVHYPSVANTDRRDLYDLRAIDVLVCRFYIDSGEVAEGIRKLACAYELSGLEEPEPKPEVGQIGRSNPQCVSWRRSTQ